eukprot:3212877-Pleurochrysis_carterae.AAC.1
MVAKRRRPGLSSSFSRAVLDFVLYNAYTLALCNTAVFLCVPGHRMNSTRGRPRVGGPLRCLGAFWILNCANPYKVSHHGKREAEK